GVDLHCSALRVAWQLGRNGAVFEVHELGQWHQPAVPGSYPIHQQVLGVGGAAAVGLDENRHRPVPDIELAHFGAVDQGTQGDVDGRHADPEFLGTFPIDLHGELRLGRAPVDVDIGKAGQLAI